MKEDVKRNVDMRTGFFDTYYTVPDAVKEDVDELIFQINSLGEQCSDVMEFETQFAQSGLSDKFNQVLAKCTPKPVSLSEEEKQHSREVTAQMMRDSKGEIAKGIAKDIADTVMLEAESEFHRINRQIMIENDTYDDYTRASNAVDFAKDVFGGIKGLFGKKK